MSSEAIFILNEALRHEAEAPRTGAEANSRRAAAIREFSGLVHDLAAAGVGVADDTPGSARRVRPLEDPTVKLQSGQLWELPAGRWGAAPMNASVWVTTGGNFCASLNADLSDSGPGIASATAGIESVQLASAPEALRTLLRWAVNDSRFHVPAELKPVATAKPVEPEGPAL